MLERLGNVLYWLGAGIGAMLLAAAAFTLTTNVPDQDRYFLAGIAAVSGAIAWLIGRALRYILAAR